MTTNPIQLKVLKYALYSVAVLLFAVKCVSATELRTARASNSCELTLGMSNWFPYQSLSSTNEPSGLQIQLLEQIAAEAGCHLRFKSITFPAGLKEIEQGKIDFMMNATVSENRRSFAYFSVPYRSEFLLLYSTKQYLGKCHNLTLEELIRDGFRLGVQPQLVYGPELTKIQNNPQLNKQLLYVDDNVQHVGLVKKEHLDGIIDDPVVVSYRSTVNTTGNILSACPIQISSSPVSFIFSKKSVTPAQVEKFNRAISKIRESNDYIKRWSW